MNVRRIQPTDRDEAPAGIVRWETPPALASRRVHWILRAAPTLRKRPGTWALVRFTSTRSQSSGNACTARKILAREKIVDIEIVSRALPDGRGAIYARALREEE